MSRQSFKVQSCPNCTIEFDFEWKDQEIVFCPLHAQAEGMRAFVRRVAYMRRPRLSTNRGDLLESLTAQARALLRAMEGK